jgi:hypothetical protein
LKSSHKEKNIEASQRRINEQQVNPAVNEHFKLQIKTLLHNVPRRDADDKLEQLLKIKDKACKRLYRF